MASAASNRPADGATKAPAVPAAPKAVAPPREPTVAERIVAALAMTVTGAESLDEIDILRFPSDWSDVENAMRSQFDDASLLATGLFDHAEEGGHICICSKIRGADAALLIRPPNERQPLTLAFDGSALSSKFAEFLLSDVKTLELVERSGGVLLAAPGICDVIAWRAVGLPAVPIQALAACPAEAIGRFWSALEGLPLAPSDKRQHLEKQKRDIAKHISAGEGHRGYMELRLAQVTGQLKRDIVVCAPTVTPAMEPDARVVPLLRRVELFATRQTLRVAQWDPQPIFREEFLRAQEQNAARQATAALYRSFREDLAFLSIDKTDDQPALDELARGADATPSGHARFLRGVEREIASPLLRLDAAAPLALGAIRLAEAAIVRRLGAMHSAASHTVTQSPGAATGLVNDIVKLSNALVRLAETELKLLDL